MASEPRLVDGMEAVSSVCHVDVFLINPVHGVDPCQGSKGPTQQRGGGPRDRLVRAVRWSV